MAMSFIKAYGKKKIYAEFRHKLTHWLWLTMKMLDLFRTNKTTILASDKTSRCDVSQTVRKSPQKIDLEK